MANYVFFIGGSGARAYKAFLHVCASGAVNRQHFVNEVNVLLLDEDSMNAACTECVRLYDAYRKNRALFQEGDAAGQSDAFWCDVKMYQTNALSPVGTRQPKLSNVPEGDAVGERALKWFYEKREREQDLSRGFYAHPNIGCIFFQNFDLSNNALTNCLNSIVGDLREERNVRIAIVGSVFGGTGAAGIPSVLNLIRDYCQSRGMDVRDKIRQDKMHFGAVLIMPYFSVDPGRADPNSVQNLTIDSSVFQSNTKSALRYYEVLDNFERLYLVGQKQLEIVNTKYSDGGREQDNKPHIVELFAAMGVKHFLENIPSQNRIMMRLLSGQPGEKISWRSGELDSDLLAIADMVRVQSVLETIVLPYYQDRQKLSAAQKLQWFKEFKMDSKHSKEDMNVMLDYGDQLLEWMYFIQYRYDGQGYNAQGQPVLKKNERIDLCGDIIQDIKDQIDKRKNNSAAPGQVIDWERLKNLLENFNGVIEGIQGVEYLVKAIPVLMSCAGVAYGGVAALCAVGFVLNLIRLTKEKEAKKGKGGNNG